MCALHLSIMNILFNLIAQTAAPIVDKLDRYGFFITYRLYREATRVTDGKLVKVCVLKLKMLLLCLIDRSRLQGSVLSEPRPVESRAAGY